MKYVTKKVLKIITIDFSFIDIVGIRAQNNIMFFYITLIVKTK